MKQEETIEMKTPKTEPFTKIPNKMIEKMCALGLNAGELSIFLCLIRHTYGFNRTECSISVETLAQKCGIDGRTVRRTLRTLEESNIISRKAEPWKIATYTLNPVEAWVDKVVPRTRLSPGQK